MHKNRKSPKRQLTKISWLFDKTSKTFFDIHKLRNILGKRFGPILCSQLLWWYCKKQAQNWWFLRLLSISAAELSLSSASTFLRSSDKGGTQPIGLLPFLHTFSQKHSASYCYISFVFKARLKARGSKAKARSSNVVIEPGPGPARGSKIVKKLGSKLEKFGPDPPLANTRPFIATDIK